ncbi:RusA family crossover junction endodeoxyribonuclease [Hansschlegelia sp.]|uniref:RusA family crossover junction endodeoxyribonuclease n=1 Tax=Hansschlegelia sp. TaxID=2041892 RepID=UPI002C1371AD|nr:RusA family crossover junction endodeoxyribonuclease [Hansschlegelia sp.]HVI27506.1 RusA family crossover junction endodeoxyribonuclease [Hansschlegelia sp.]
MSSAAAISFTIPGLPVAWARAGRGGGVTFTPAKQRSFMADCRTIAAAAMKGRAPLSGPIEMSVVFAYPWPASWSAKKRAAPGAEWKVSRPDGSNLRKLIEDAINGVVYGDDAQIASGHDWKRFEDSAETRVQIRSLAEAPAEIAADRVFAGAAE